MSSKLCNKICPIEKLYALTPTETDYMESFFDSVAHILNESFDSDQETGRTVRDDVIYYIQSMKDERVNEIMQGYLQHLGSTQFAWLKNRSDAQKDVDIFRRLWFDGMSNNIIPGNHGLLQFIGKMQCISFLVIDINCNVIYRAVNSDSRYTAVLLYHQELYSPVARKFGKYEVLTFDDSVTCIQNLLEPTESGFSRYLPRFVSSTLYGGSS